MHGTYSGVPLDCAFSKADRLQVRHGRFFIVHLVLEMNRLEQPPEHALPAGSSHRLRLQVTKGCSRQLSGATQCSKIGPITMQRDTRDAPGVPTLTQVEATLEKSAET